MTVTKMLLGLEGPMSNREFTYWSAYFSRKMQLEEEAAKPKKSQSGKASQEFKRTMGPKD